MWFWIENIPWLRLNLPFILPVNCPFFCNMAVSRKYTFLTFEAKCICHRVAALHREIQKIADQQRCRWTFLENDMKMILNWKYTLVVIEPTIHFASKMSLFCNMAVSRKSTFLTFEAKCICHRVAALHRENSRSTTLQMNFSWKWQQDAFTSGRHLCLGPDCLTSMKMLTNMAHLQYHPR